jgi:hypothetical protein
MVYSCRAPKAVWAINLTALHHMATLSVLPIEQLPDGTKNSAHLCVIDFSRDKEFRKYALPDLEEYHRSMLFGEPALDIVVPLTPRAQNRRLAAQEGLFLCPMHKRMPEMQTDRVLGVFRFSKRKYINAFVRGQLFMNTLEHFSKIEANAARRDQREGQSFWMQPDKVTFSVKISGVFEPIRGIVGPIAHTESSNLAANVFCMYALRASVAKRLVDPRNFEFGHSFAILRDADEFLRRVRSAAKKAGHEVRWGLVEYVNPSSYHGPMGIFRKSSEFAYQSEARIAILPGTGSPLKLDVGDLSDIVLMTGPLKRVDRVLRVV